MSVNTNTEIQTIALTRSQHWLPVSFKCQPVRILRLDCMFPVLGCIYHGNSEETDNNRKLQLTSGYMDEVGGQTLTTNPSPKQIRHIASVCS